MQGYRLSPQQRRLWRLRENGARGLAQCALQIDGRLDAAAAAAALARLVERHDVLRTSFRTSPGLRTALQVVAERAAVDHRDEPAGGGDAERIADRLLAEERRRGVDPAAVPVLRSRLARLAPDRAVWILTLPALCADARALVLLAGELGAELSGGGAAAEDGLPFLNVSEWQNQLLEDEDAAAGRARWQAADAAALEGVALPGVERPWAPPPEESAALPASVPVPLTGDDLAALERLADSWGTTLPRLVLAGWQLLLGRLSGATAVTVGAVCDGRRYDELAAAVGPLSRAVPVTVRVEPEIGFRRLVARVAGAVDEAGEWQEYFAPEGEAEATPFGFGWGALELPAPRDAGELRLTVLAAESEVEPFAAAAVCRRRAAGDWRVRLDRHGGGLDGPTAARLASRLAALLAGVVARPEAPAGDLPVLAPDERERLLVHFNDTARAWPDDALLHDLVARWAETRPGDAAAVCGDRSLTFGELDRRARALAARLRGLGVGPETVVGIAAGRSLDSLVAVLAVLRAGGAYLPLDPAWPERRLRLVIERSRAAVVLAGDGSAEALAGCGAAVVPLAGAAGAQEEDGAGAGAEGARPGPDSLAYVLYTSGSTGEPKGVMVSHRAVTNYLRWAVDAYRVAEGGGAPVQSALGFDLTVTALFAPLVAGRPVQLLPDDGGLEALAGALRGERRWSFAKLTPAHLQALEALLLADGGGADAGGELAAGTLVLGGEALLGEQLAAWRRRVPDLELVNEYGPTEATVGCAVHRVAPGAPAAGAVPIGRPIANARLVLLDRRGQPVPEGAVGEIHVGGAGLARGYLGLAARTAERFVPDPFAAAPGERLYRTGDLARHRPDGELEFLGRADHQVKVRGHRVELGEIEATLAGHPAVRQCVAGLAGESDRRRLVAWYVAERGERAGAGELASWLAERLPEPMVPAGFVELDFLPLTAHGKVDRAALPEPDRTAAAAAHQAPRDEIERILAGIWQEVLRIERVGVHDNFFRLGGDSILGVQVIARAHEAGLRLTSRQLFDHQTIAELAEVAGAAGSTVADQGPVTGDVPLTPIQRWFFDLGLERPSHFNQPLLLGLRRPVPAERLAAALDRLLEHHDALRLRFRRGGDHGWRQWNAPPGGPPPFTRVDLSALPAGRRAEARAGVAASSAASLDIERGPLLRMLLLDDGDGPGRLLVVPHHLAMDGVSSRILVDDLRALLEAGDGRPALPPKTTSYRRWAESLARRAAGRVHDDELGHWTAAARAGAAPLPADDPDGPDDVAHQRSVPVWLEEDETRELLQEVPRAYNTRINDVLLTCLAATLAEWTGSRRQLIDLESHGRGEVDEGLDVSRTVGWFTAFFPVLLEIDAGADLGASLKAVKEQLRAVPRDGVGYGVLRWLHPDDEVRAKLADLPAAEIIFNYLGQFDQGGGEDPLFALLRESAGPARDPRSARAHRMAINGRVLGGRLVLEWTYSEGRHRRETVEALAAAFLDRLRALVEHCRAAAAGGYTPSDFPLAAVGQEELDRALGEVELDE